MTAYFVTGTDTGCGKTTVTHAILAAFTARGLRTACMKPMESGCPADDAGTLQPQDALRLRAACSLTFHLDVTCPYRFAPAVAPGIAAVRANRVIDKAVIRSALRTIFAARPDITLIEGAGGLLVPIGPTATMRDLVVELDLPLLIVARSSLGTINHTLLTVEAAVRGGIHVAGILLNEQQPDTDPREIAASMEAIASRCAAPILGLLPHLATGVSPAAATTHLALDRLLA